MTKTAASAAFLALILASGRSVAASWPGDETKTLPCRPTVACTAELAAPGTLEIESGSFLSKNRAGDRTLSFPFLFKQTLAPFLQLQLGSNGYTVARGSASAHYFDNVVLGPKLHMLDQSELLPAFAITVQASLPTFEADGYARHDHAFFTGHASKDAGRLHVDVNGGVNLWQIDARAAAQGFGVVTLSTSIAGPFGGALETYYFSDAAPAAVRDGGVRMVVNASPRPWLVLDVGGDVGFFPETRAFSLFLGMTFVPVVLTPMF